MEQIISIGARLRQVREEMDKTQSDFAAIASAAGVPGATRQSQAKYEKGLSSPSAAYLAAISDAGADVLFILTGRKEMQREKYPALVEDFLLRHTAHYVGKSLWKAGITPETFARGELDESGFDRGQRIWLMTLIKLTTALYNSKEWAQGDEGEREKIAYGMALSEWLHLQSEHDKSLK